MPPLRVVTPPAHPVALDDAVELYPTLRQSLLAKYDDCPLSAYMEMRFSNGWSTHPQARGTIFHRAVAEILRDMKRNGSRTIPVQVGLAILVEVCRQRDIPPEEIVRVPLREMRDLRMAVAKFCRDNEFSIEKVAAVEERLSATLTYPRPDGGFVVRTLTGQIDALLYSSADSAVVLDWKDTWALPPEPKERTPGSLAREEDELRGISYHGYFQQRFYGWLVMRNFPQIRSVTLREFYARRTKVRKATLTRDKLTDVEEELAVLVQQFDSGIQQGAPPFPFGWWPTADENGELDGGRAFDIGRMGWWKPQPGKHCGFCPRSRHCPIDEDTRIEVGAPPATPDRAAALAAEWQVIEAVKEKIVASLKAWNETSGAPIPVRWSKGRRLVGWFTTGRGRRFGFYTPDESDRGGHTDIDRALENAMREATARAREERA